MIRVAQQLHLLSVAGRFRCFGAPPRKGAAVEEARRRDDEEDATHDLPRERHAEECRRHRAVEHDRAAHCKGLEDIVSVLERHRDRYTSERRQADSEPGPAIEADEERAVEHVRRVVYQHAHAADRQREDRELYRLQPEREFDCLEELLEEHSRIG